MIWGCYNRKISNAFFWLRLVGPYSWGRGGGRGVLISRRFTVYHAFCFLFEEVKVASYQLLFFKDYI